MNSLIGLREIVQLYIFKGIAELAFNRDRIDIIKRIV